MPNLTIVKQQQQNNLVIISGWSHKIMQTVFVLEPKLSSIVLKLSSANVLTAPLPAISASVKSPFQQVRGEVFLLASIQHKPNIQVGEGWVATV